MTSATMKGLKALMLVTILALAVLSVAGMGAVVGHKQAEATAKAAGGLFDSLVPESPPAYTIVKDTPTDTTVYIVSGIDEPFKYIEVMELLRNAKLGDTITFKITSPGGFVSTMLMLADGIATSNAHTVANIQGGAYSAAAYISLAADEIQMAEGSVIMFHDTQVQIRGERSKIVTDLVASGKQIEEFLRKYNTQGVLTEGEIVGLFKGQDVFLTKEEVDARIKANKEKKERAVTQGDATGSSSIGNSGLFVGYTGSDHILSPVRYAH